MIEENRGNANIPQVYLVVGLQRSLLELMSQIVGFSNCQVLVTKLVQDLHQLITNDFGI